MRLGPDEVREALEEALGSLGESTKKVTLYYLEAKLGVKPENLASRPEALAAILREIYGPLAGFVERHVLQRVALKLGFDGVDSFTALAAWLGRALHVNPSEEARCRHSLGLAEALQRLIMLLTQRGLRLASIEVDEGGAVVKARGGSIVATGLDSYYREVEASIGRGLGSVTVAVRVSLPGASISSGERTRLREEAQALAELRGPEGV